MPAGIRYLVFGYFMYEEARRLSDTIGCHPIFVRYNVALFDRAMSIRPGEHRCFVTHDQDNADSPRTFLASAYTEVDVTRYHVWPVRTWLKCTDERQRGDQTWATVTAPPRTCVTAWTAPDCTCCTRCSRPTSSTNSATWPSLPDPRA